MHATTVLASLLATLAVSNALQVTSPSEDSVWSSGDSQTIEWDAVSTDPTSFEIQLVYSGGQNGVTIVANQSSSDGSATVTYPDGNWPTGTAFQINLLSAKSAILAQSSQFNITDSSSSSSSSAASSTSSGSSAAVVSGSTSGLSSTSTSVSSTSSGSSSAASGKSTTAAASTTGSSSSSGAIPNAATTTSASSGSALTSSVAIGSIALAFVGALSVIA